ncbi:hypothetical protein CABS01_01076 [Colletotrichum abscissum]|uniref:Uncharacterized protein n=1 Tax=Colletotrichum costaricense TaxID=1209916 RepID=A0AAJ0E0D4_9PEZI|nr:uncharacterized protein CCOS01_08447 [Colletotrichum costaricense]XP_060401534.1 uncharacterized protein CABS01_01076 [Colletotrichum abscissum]KAK1505608.1 hypothetical protein CABS01_01076 [Colletotrichum abscissum]KAK1526029.1 hypothetical protein CCOS01_08447 [Colletotrichum costaricense]
MPALVAGKEPSDFNDSTGQCRNSGGLHWQLTNTMRILRASCDLAVLEDDVAPSRWKPEM